MALCRCPECGREGVSETAKSCPNCGFNICAHYKKEKKKNTAYTLRKRLLAFINTKLGTVWLITFLIGIIYVCVMAYGVTEKDQVPLLLLPAGYYCIAYLGIGLLMKWFFDDAVGVATVVISPMGVSLVAFAIANHFGWLTYPFIA